MRRRLMHAVALAALVSPMLAPAAIDLGEGFRGDDGSSGEFYLVILDATKEATYVLDLGLQIGTLLSEGQSDAGYQRFWTLDRTADANLNALLNLGSAVGSLQWGVFAGDFSGANFGYGENEYRLFTTLVHDTPTGTRNPNYTRLTGVTNADLVLNLGYYAGAAAMTGSLNTVVYAGNDHPTGGSAEYANHASSLSLKGQAGYFGAVDGSSASAPTLGNQLIPVMPLIGFSSWAYFLTPSLFQNFDDNAAVLVDEFDNLEHDAYWGLAQHPDTGVLYLSYTLQAIGLSPAQREFSLGIGRTEFNAGFAVRALGAAAAGNESPALFSSRVLGASMLPAVSAVPEPTSTALMLLGLTVVAGLARRHR